MRFVLPLPPNRANARGSWRVHHAAKAAYWNTLDNIQLLGRPPQFVIPRPPKKPLARANVYAVLYVWAKMDEGNAINRMK